MNARQKRIFHGAFAATSCLAAAARAAGLTPAEARRLARAAPPAPSPDEDPALDRAIAALESEAVRRALAGVEIPVFHQGRECGSTVKHSDTLLMFLLKTLKPERYASGRDAAAPDAARPVALEVDLSAGAEDEG